MGWKVPYAMALLPYVLLCMPFVLTTRFIAHKKAREAKHASQVKIEGKDVITTWKLLVSTVLVPTLHAVYTAMALAYGGRVLGVAYFFFSPFVFYMGVRGVEEGRWVVRGGCESWVGSEWCACAESVSV